jgi:hypothetical protein
MEKITIFYLKARERLAAKNATGGTGEPPKSILVKPADASKSTPVPQDKVSSAPMHQPL